jgi:thiol peroxidase
MVTLKGEFISLEGHPLQVKQSSPNFELVTSKLDRVSLNAYEGKIKILNVFPSIDTEVCATSVNQFHERLQVYNQNRIVVLHISKDLPFAHKRFCAAQNHSTAITLSAFDSSFGKDFGVQISSGLLKGLLTRSVFILDAQNVIQYIEIVSEITNPPNYGRVFEVLEHYFKNE